MARDYCARCGRVGCDWGDTCDEIAAERIRSELKPCPFCGGTDLERDSSESSPHDIAVACQTCFARGPNTCTYGQPKGSYDTGADWNKRV